MIAFVVVMAVGLDWLLGEPRRWHPLVGFGRYAHYLENRLHRDDTHSATAARWRGLCALGLAVIPPTVLCMYLVKQPYVGTVLNIAVLYLVIGHRSLHDHALRVFDALCIADLATARSRVSMIVSRDCEAMQARDVARAAIESVLENGSDALFGALFWFVLAGAPGALLYRLANTLDAMWGYRTLRYRYFGWAAARFDDLLNLIPARLTALTYASVGHVASALRCWRHQAMNWESPNAGPVMAAGAGSLRVKLGGPAFYHGHWKSRPLLGEGDEPNAADIMRALYLVARSLMVWIAVIAALEYWHA